MESIGPYRLLEEIGAGGFGRVYRAEHSDLGIRAVKIASNADFADYLRREGRALSRLRHERIVTIHHLDVDHDPPYLVMDYFAKGDLRRHLKQGPLPIKEAIQIMLDVLDALQHAHSNGVIHRDIKPSNILLDEDNRARVSDFGLGKVPTESSISGAAAEGDFSGSRSPGETSGTVSGTLRYMSPEQADPSLLAGGKLDGRSDLYSLGLVFYEMLTGEFPAGAWEPPSSLRPGIATDLDEIVRKMLGRRREQRFSTAAEVRERLRVLYKPREAEAQRTPGPASRIWLWAALVVAICAAAVLVISIRAGKRATTLDNGMSLKGANTVARGGAAPARARAARTLVYLSNGRFAMKVALNLPTDLCEGDFLVFKIDGEQVAKAKIKAVRPQMKATMIEGIGVDISDTDAFVRRTAQSRASAAGVQQPVQGVPALTHRGTSAPVSDGRFHPRPRDVPEEKSRHERPTWYSDSSSTTTRRTSGGGAGSTSGDAAIGLPPSAASDNSKGVSTNEN